jgi:hypothetical protein
VVTDNGLAFMTIGDANEDPDHWVIPASAVLGKVQHRVPYLGYVADALRDRGTFYLFVGIPLVMLIVSESVNLSRELLPRLKAPPASQATSEPGRRSLHGSFRTLEAD